MKVTDVRLRKIQTDGRMKALVSITLDDAFVVHDLRVIEGNSGLFVAMPSKRTPDGEFRDIAHPINSDMRQEIQDAVMKVYDETDEVIPDKNAKQSESEDNDNEEA
ncbi:septation regulator SpoVG [Staphylococcus simulans]|uniref:septation regulator SpoVG n=1 Tax=Staphylococcus simulans TaxID=1286 RepID=UPI000E68D10D|nr:septation regulator SpoVG [Staphylococcus simulans]RIN77724.1 septation protein SpoVG [Staphylococcus simulans]